MTVSCDFRDLLARSVTLGTRVWGLSETLAPPEMVKDLAMLGDEATFLNAMGISPTEDNDRLLQLSSFLDSGEAAEALSHEGERWQVPSIVTAAKETLQPVGNSLAEDSTPARAGRLLRALPLMAGSKFTVMGHRLAQALGVDPEPESLIAAYGDAFCRRSERILAAVDRVIIDDEVLGPVVVELAGRLMLWLGCDGIYLDKEGREALINCLALLIGGAIEKTSLSGAGTNGRNAEEEMT